MPAVGHPMPAVRQLLPVLLMLTLLVGCSSMSYRDPVRISVAGIEPLSNEGLEARFAVTLRVQNPNDVALEFDGVFVDLEIEDRNFGSGVSDQTGSVPRFGETLVTVPVVIPFTSVLRQLMGLADKEGAVDGLSYRLRGHLGGNRLFGGLRFDKEGTFELGGLSDR